MPHPCAYGLLVLLAAAVPLAAQADQPASGHHERAYAGLEGRAIKALSDREIADLRAGRGMGLALPAELNGYPGPVHVLEHADALALSPAQLRHTRELFDAMTAEAVALGERLILQEAELDGLFATRTVETATLGRATAAAAATQGELRAVHLRYHIAMAKLLTPEQVRRYAELRGYASHGHGAHP